MDPTSPVKEKFFIVLRGKSLKGFSRGCVGRVESEPQLGQLSGTMYAAGSGGVSRKSGGVVRREDTYPLTRHQAQLLLLVSSPSKRLEVLCNPQLFSAVCELRRDDLVVVRHKRKHLPGLVKNVMQVGKKENQDDLCMLGFEVQPVDHDPSKKPAAPLPLFSAADIMQVLPSSCTTPLEPQWQEGKYGGLNKKAVTRVNSMPSIGSHARRVRETRTEQSATQSQSSSASHVPLDVGSIVEVTSNTGITVYGVIRWRGVLKGKMTEWAGIELDYDVNGCSNGKYGGQRYFTCKGSRALFIPISKCSPDSRLIWPGGGTHKAIEIPPVPPYDETMEDALPIPESEVLSLLAGRMKGIQGHVNSCYLDATLFSLACSSMNLDVCQNPAESEQPLIQALREIVNRLRRQGFVPAESVMNFRKKLGCDTFLTEEKDPEEFITILFKKVLCMEPLLKLRSSEENSQGAYTLQLIVDKDQMAQMPTVQQLLDTSCLSVDLKFEEVPSFLLIQMPRFGNKFKMFSSIIPSTELDVTDLLYKSPRECSLCGQSAELECVECLPDLKMEPWRIKQYCKQCSTQVHTHPKRQGHSPKALAMPEKLASDSPVPRHTMQLFAVLCIKTSHYVSFVKYGPDPKSWIFFDSMADRCGDDQNGYNIPEIRPCPEMADFLCLTAPELALRDPTEIPERVRRLLCDSYMFLYQNPAKPLSKCSNQDS